MESRLIKRFRRRGKAFSSSFGREGRKLYSTGVSDLKAKWIANEVTFAKFLRVFRGLGRMSQGTSRAQAISLRLKFGHLGGLRAERGSVVNVAEDHAASFLADGCDGESECGRGELS